MTNQSETPETNKSRSVEDKIIRTRHTVTIGDELIHYTATTGTMILKAEDRESGEKPRAAIFFVAYTRDRETGRSEADHAAGRPITFSFNGGPGSSSVWLHLGLLGPRRVQSADGNEPVPPPYALVDNAFSLLDQTDLVFIDPVTTGFSRAVPGENDRDFHSFEKDIESVGDFIRLYTTRYQRWSSPKFLAGESYGTTRSAGLAGYLQERHGMYLNGLMLISSVLNFQTLMFSPGNDLPYILFLPTYAATAWYHGRLDNELQQDLDQLLADVRAFALGEYATALMHGASLPEAQAVEIASQLARYTGLSESYIRQSNLRIEIGRFVKELMREQRETVGRLDSRIKGVDRDAAGEHYEFDPSMALIMGPYTGALNDYVRRELGFESDLPYEILTGRVHPWSYGSHENQYVNVAETLRKAMNANPFLKVFVGNGYYDLATPFLATEYTFDHLFLEPGDRERVAMGYYEAGHMMYIHDPSLAQIKADMASFLASAVPGRTD